MIPEQPESLVAERWEEALDVWSEFEWDWGDDEEVIAATCDTENPEICESCQ